MLTGRVPPEETLPTAFRPAGVRSITEMEPSPSLATKSHRRSWLSARAPWEPTDTTPPPLPPVGTVAARESVPSAALLNTKTELFNRLLSVYTNPPLNGSESFDCAILTEVMPAMAIAGMTIQRLRVVFLITSSLLLITSSLIEEPDLQRGRAHCNSLLTAP